MLSFTNIINTSALSYQSSVGVGFTFNPTLSVNISSSDLVISNLAPGTTNDSNTINVSVATNVAYGYTLSAIMNGNNSNLIHTNNANTFSGIATNASLTNLTTDNTWGYSYKLSNDTNWNNYSGLSTETSKTLIDSNDQTAIPIDFKIAAKASSAQPSGEYGNIINFMAVSKVGTVSLLDAFVASNATMQNGYYTMQGMTPAICNAATIGSSLQLLDVRDNKLYWVTKLADNNCWMTQNLDLDLSSTVALTSETSDIDPDSYGKTIYTAETGYSKDNETNVVSWLPRTDTMSMSWTSATAATVPDWINDNYKPYSADSGDRYKYTDDAGNETVYTSFEACRTATNDAEGCQHIHIGNYYNWSTSVASNNTNSTPHDSNWDNSICPKNWNLPIKGQYSAMLSSQGVTINTVNYGSDGFLKIRTSPLYLMQSGYVYNKLLNHFTTDGYYWSSTVYYGSRARNLLFNSDRVSPDYDIYYGRGYGFSVRCVTSVTSGG